MRLRPTPLGPASACPLNSNGRSPRNPGTSRRNHLMPRAPIQRLSSLASCKTSGSGPQVLTIPIRATVRRPAQSENTTENSWSTRWCCAGARARHRRAMSARPIAISFRRRRAGNSVVFASQRTRDMSALGSIERLYDLEPSLDEFRAAVIAGLSRPQKTLPCKFFYDGEGSRLFDQICALPEYYPTRTELLILEQRASTIARLMGSRVRLVEFGSGAGIKIRLLLRALNQPAAYVPVDISRQ